MTAPLRFDQLDSTRQSAIRRNLDILHAKHASDDEIDAYLSHDEGLSPAEATKPGGAERLHAEFKAGTLAPRIASENAQEKAIAEADEGALRPAAGGLAALIKDVPGGEAAQAGIRALVRRQPYREALTDIRGAEDAAPAAVRTLNRLLGAGLSQALIPGSAVTKGALYGALHGFTDADPDADRRTETVQQGILGGVLGAGAEAAGAVGGRIGSAVRGQIQKEKNVIGSISGAFSKAPTPVVKQPAAPSVAPKLGLTLADPPIDPPPPVAKPVAKAPAPSAPKPSIEEQMRAISRKVGGNLDAPPEWTDEEIAMGHNTHVQPDLEELLRQSIQLKGGKPVVPRSSSIRLSP